MPTIRASDYTCRLDELSGDIRKAGCLDILINKHLMNFIMCCLIHTRLTSPQSTHLKGEGGENRGSIWFNKTNITNQECDVGFFPRDLQLQPQRQFRFTCAFGADKKYSVLLRCNVPRASSGVCVFVAHFTLCEW